MSLRHFEDLAVGESFDLGSRTAIEDEALGFAREFDPQPFHLSSLAAERSMLGGLATSGWYTAAMLSRMLWNKWLRHVNGAGSSGAAKHAWSRPLYVGGTMYAQGTVTAMRESKTMPGVGFVEIALNARLGNNRKFCTARWTIMVHRRAGPKPDFAERQRLYRTRKHDGIRSMADARAFGRDMLYLDLCRMGYPVFLGEVSASAEQMIRFSRAYNPQPFLTSEKAANKSHFGGLAASGWHSCGLVMRTYVDSRLRALDSLSEEERSTAAVSGGIGVEFENLRFINPVRANETMAAYITPLERRKSRLRQRWDKLYMRAELRNASNQPVVQFYPTVYMSESPETNSRQR